MDEGGKGAPIGGGFIPIECGIYNWLGGAPGIRPFATEFCRLGGGPGGGAKEELEGGGIGGVEGLGCYYI